MMLRTKQVKMMKFRQLPLVFNTSELNYVNNLEVTIYICTTEYATTKFRQLPLLYGRQAKI